MPSERTCPNCGATIPAAVIACHTCGWSENVGVGERVAWTASVMMMALGALVGIPGFWFVAFFAASFVFGMGYTTAAVIATIAALAVVAPLASAWAKGRQDGRR